MSEQTRLTVRDRARLFERSAVSATNGHSSSLADIGNNADSNVVNNNNSKGSGSDFSSTPALPQESSTPVKRVSQLPKPAVPPKPQIDLKEILLNTPSRENSQRYSLLSDGSENLSHVSNLTTGTATSSTSDHDHDNGAGPGQSSDQRPASESGSSAPPDEVVDVNQRILNVVNELVSTEESYIDILDLLIKEFPVAMTCLLNGEPSVETLKGVLCIEELKPIRDFHSDHLLPEFKKRLADWQSHPCISDIILKSVKFFKVYSSFVVNQETVVQEFDRLIDYYPDFKRAVDNFQSQAMLKPAYSAIKGRMAFRFTELFRAPFNRLFHYKNLLERYSKELSKQSSSVPNPDLEGAQKAILEMDSVIRHLNAKMAEETENKKFEEKLRNLRSKLQNSEEFFKDKELKLIREGQLLKRSRKADQIRYVVLFDTHIIIAKPHQIGNAFSIKYTFDLQSAKAFVDERDPRNFVLSVPLPYSSSTFRTSSPNECDEWVQELEECRRRLVPSESGAEESNQPLRLPPWKPDHMFTNCTLCARRFTNINRKHHCRLCGLVYCESCSKQRWPVVSGHLLRVCDICYAICTIDSCPSAELPSGVLEQVGGSRTVWEAKTHQEKWYLYKEEFFAKSDDCCGEYHRNSIAPASGQRRPVPYLREIIAASLSCARSGYLYVFDPKASKFVSRWVVLEQDCLIVFEACQNTIALERHFLAGFRFEGPFPIAQFPALKQSADTVSVKFVFTCFHENYNNLAESLAQAYQSPNSSTRRRNVSPSLFRMFSNNSNSSTSSPGGGGGSGCLYFLFGVEEDYIAEDWIKELQQIRRHSELVANNSNNNSTR